MAIDAVPIDSPDAPPPPDVHVVITADNAYSFGYGDVAGIATYVQGTRAVTAGQIRSTGSNTCRAYLIFRLATVDIPVG